MTAHEHVLLLEALQVSDHVANLIWVEPELRHSRMNSYDSFRQRALQILDRIFEMQGAECRRDWKLALARLVDGMALCAVSAYEGQTSLRGRRLRESPWAIRQ
jgi:hypothetical protein